MTRINCPIFHDSDGLCCDGDQPCLNAAERSPLLYTPPQAVTMTEILWLIVGLAGAMLVLLIAFVQLERQQRIDDIANQEMRPSVIIAAEGSK